MVSVMFNRVPGKNEIFPTCEYLRCNTQETVQGFYVALARSPQLQHGILSQLDPCNNTKRESILKIVVL